MFVGASEKAPPVEENERTHCRENHDAKDPQKSATVLNPRQSADIHPKDAGDQSYGQENRRQKRNNVKVLVGGLCSPTGDFFVEQSGSLLNGVQIEGDAVETFNGAKQVGAVVLSPPSKRAMGYLRHGTSLGVDMSTQSGQQTSDSAEFPSFPQKAVLEDFIFHMVNQITLAGNNRSENIGEILDELDNEAQSTRDRQPTTKLQAQLVNNFEGMEASCYDETFIYEEVDYAEAIRISVELEMQIPENPCKAALYSFEADMQIGIEQNLPRAHRDSFGRTDPFFGSDVGKAEMEPDGFIKLPIRFAGDVPG